MVLLFIIFYKVLMPMLIIFGIGLVPILLTWVMSRRIQKNGTRILVRAGIVAITHFSMVFLINAIGYMDELCLAHDDSDLADPALCSGPNPNLNMLKLFGKILYFPIILLLLSFDINLGKWEIIVLILNSCWWGFGIVFLITSLPHA